MLCLAESKKVVIVGIPGAGKTTLVSKIVEILKNKNKSVSVHSFGSVMFEEAKKLETRNKRIALVCLQLKQGKKRPCCWPGCSHRFI